MRTPPRSALRPVLRSAGVGLLAASVLSPAAPALAAPAPAPADTVLAHVGWSCDAPYSGELQCAPPLAVPPGGHLWIGDDTGGPTIFQVYREASGGRTRVGWIEMRHGEGLAYTNTTDRTVVVAFTVHEDAPTDRCGSQPEHGFAEVRA